MVSKFDNQNAIFGDHTNQHDHANLAVNVHPLSHNKQPKETAKYSHRYRQHYHQRVDKAFKLSSQHQISNQQRQSKHNGYA
ncbi:Uncharacterised protein [Vibrio cholerae]|nr:Uncharacterised protein [Vibrio cholerae]CSD41663.1 Uncharacterised protein [Vibrio cholerae]